ncbi:MAG: PLP-dependent transferase, partial [Rhizobiales bacterium]|nr:PLP-dependent transferase [Hyphomicrobiales bacterium]
PFNAWLLLRGAQTLALRLEKQCANARKLAEYLEKHPQVKRVFYPGLESHPNYASAKEQLKDGGAMLSFCVVDEASGVRLLKRLKLCSFAASLGGLRTTTQMPATMAFLDIPSQEREAMGVVDGLVRFSVGIEHIDDIIADVDQAIAQMHIDL